MTHDSALLLVRVSFGVAGLLTLTACWFSRSRLSAGAVRTINGLLLLALGTYGLLCVLAALPGGGEAAAGLGVRLGKPLVNAGGLLSAVVPLLLLLAGVIHFLDLNVRPYLAPAFFAAMALFGVEAAVGVATSGAWEVLYGGWGAAISRGLITGLGAKGAWVAVVAWIAVNLLLAFPLDVGQAVRQAVARVLLLARRAAVRISRHTWVPLCGWWERLRARVRERIRTRALDRAHARAVKREREISAAQSTATADGSRKSARSVPPVAEREVPGIPAATPVTTAPSPSTPRVLEVGEVAEGDDAAIVAPPSRQHLAPEADIADYRLPPLSILEATTEEETYRPSRDELISHADALERKLADFGVDGSVRKVSPGPVITRFEVVPAPGVKINKIANLADDLAMSLKAERVRILAPIPGKDAVGVEVPNKRTSMVRLREILDSEAFADRSVTLPIALGQTIEGKPFVADLTRMPHLLIAGATGAGKSVCINAIIASLLYQASPRDLRLMMVDPKMLELSVYNGIPHLITPVITNPKEVSKALQWAVAEMEERYRTLAKLGVRSIAAYNRRVLEIAEERERAAEEHGSTLLPGEEEVYGTGDDGEGFAAPEAPDEAQEDLPATLPYMVIIVDELADLMLTVANEIEEPIARLAQMARAVGIHLVLATQRPSVNVITGVIKANFPSRIAFQVASKIDSRTILDQNGAEKLLGRGDMLFLAAGSAAPTRVHGAFLSDHEVKRLVDYIAAQGIQSDRIDFRESADDPCLLDFERDALYEEALKLTVLHQQGSASLLQRRLKVGYARASRLIDELEASGIVGPFEGSKSREVLVGVDYLEQLGLVRPDETNA